MLVAALLWAGPASAQSSIVSLTLSPSTIAGGSGAAATGTVTLSAPAPAGGALVTLSSSNIALAATMPNVRVPAAQTTATFPVATNPWYRRYSGLSFNVTISATLGTTRTAVVTVTAQPRPADFNSGSTAGANTQWDGLMCGGVAPIGGEPGILYSCSPPDASGFGTCTFQQECTIGCRRVPPNGSRYNDFCATTGPNPVSVSSTYFQSGDRIPASVVFSGSADEEGPDREVGSLLPRNPDFNVSDFPHDSLTFPTGATSVTFDVATSYVPTVQFIAVDGFWFNASIPPLLITNARAGQAWMTMYPPTPAPAVALPTLGDWFISGLNPITGGDQTFGQVDLSGLSRAGGPTLELTSSHPSIVPSKTIVAPASENLLGFQAFFETNATSSDTDVTVTLSDGRYSFSDVLTVRAAPPAPLLQSVSVSPTSVVGGNQAVGRVTLSAPQSSPTVVQVSIIDSAPATLPSNDPPCPPSSRCHNVTIPAGATTADFTINTSTVTSQFNLNIFARIGTGQERQALLLIGPGGSTTLKALSVSPDSVVGGTSATGTVTLTGAAPAGGALVTLSKAFANGSAGTVPLTIPASVTVPAGQTTANFTISSSSVTTTTVAMVTAIHAGTTLNAFLSLYPLLGQLLFNGTVPGGSPAIGTVVLNGPAPSGGAVVALSSANTSLVTVPASVTVPAGQTSVDFTANTNPVTQFTSVTITAARAGTTVSSALFLSVSTAPSSVTLNPSTVVGGASSTATVTLANPATGNAFVTLASSNELVATVPNSVIVPGGQRTATFTVNTGSVATTTAVQISATHEGVTRSGTLTVTPAGGGGGGGGAPGFLSPSVNASDTGGDGNGFESGPANAQGDDAAVATDINSGTGSSTSCTNSGKDRHRYWNFGFPIPAGSTIAGIEVRLDARADTMSGNPRMCVQLSWDGGATWTAPKATSTLGTSLTSFTLGGVSDTWGRTWTPANFADANFRLRIINVASSSSRDFFLEWVAVQPHVTASGPASLSGVSVTPASVTGGTASTGTVTLTAGAPAGGALVSLTSSNTAAGVPASVNVPAGATSATFTVTTSSVAANTAVTITATYDGVSRRASLTVTPDPPPASLQAVSVSPTSVTGGATSTGTVTLSSAALSGGALVALSSSNSGVAAVPSSVAVAAGATSATFTATTSNVAAVSPVTITVSYGGATRTTTLTVNPPPQAATLTVTATGRTGERVMSSPAGINVNVGTTASASFSVGTSITLSVTNGRDAIWSGACSTNGNKTRTCTFTLNGNASVNANVQ